MSPDTPELSAPAAWDAARRGAMRLHPRCGFPARAASRKARPLAERCLSKSRYRTPVEVLEPGIAERRERSPACAHGEINNKKSDTPGRGRPSPVARLARLLGRPRRPAVIVDCACRPRAFVHREGSQSVSQSVISRTHPALTPPPALNPAPMEGSTRLSVNDLETITTRKIERGILDSAYWDQARRIGRLLGEIKDIGSHISAVEIRHRE